MGLRQVNLIFYPEILSIMVCNDNTIKGIEINPIHFKITNYVDGTVFILDDTEVKLRNSLF